MKVEIPKNRKNSVKEFSKEFSKANHRVCVCKHETGRSQFDDSVWDRRRSMRERSIRTVNKREDAALRQHNKKTIREHSRCEPTKSKDDGSG